MKRQEDRTKRSFLPSIGRKAGSTAVDPARFRAALLAWYDVRKRDLPWRRTCDPYAIWISEIMLQQTRVASAIPYYERFLQQFPNVESLASAPEAELLARWAGLGYYHRARNLQEAAKRIVKAGKFPSSFEDIRALPGIGPYTAAAVASIAFGLPRAALDGNVLRVLSRIFNDATEITSHAGRKHFASLAAELLAPERPGDFNQAMMELGATVCLPNRPQCLLCPVSSLCQARRSGRTAELPVKAARRSSVAELRQLLWIERDGKLLVWRRPAHATLMPGFWELPECGQVQASLGTKLGSFRHTITFHRYLFDIFEACIVNGTGFCEWLTWQDLNRSPVSTVLKKARKVVFRHTSQLAAKLGC